MKEGIKATLREVGCKSQTFCPLDVFFLKSIKCYVPCIFFLSIKCYVNLIEIETGVLIKAFLFFPSIPYLIYYLLLMKTNVF